MTLGWKMAWVRQGKRDVGFIRDWVCFEWGGCEMGMWGEWRLRRRKARLDGEDWFRLNGDEQRPVGPLRGQLSLSGNSHPVESSVWKGRRRGWGVSWRAWRCVNVFKTMPKNIFSYFMKNLLTLLYQWKRRVAGKVWCLKFLLKPFYIELSVSQGLFAEGHGCNVINILQIKGKSEHKDRVY